MKKKVISVCDVCKKYVEKDTYLKLEFNGRFFLRQSYDFCSTDCLKQFINTNECMKDLKKRGDTNE